MYTLFRRKTVLPEDAESASILVGKREGKKYTKNCKKLCKIVGLPPGGRLQPSVWKSILTANKGILEDNNLLDTARAWFRTAAVLQKEGWQEIEVDQGDVKLYGYVLSEKSKVQVMDSQTSLPPSYNSSAADSGVGPGGWICPVCDCQNPDYCGVCYNCGGQRPHSLPAIAYSPPLYPPLPVAVSDVTKCLPLTVTHRSPSLGSAVSGINQTPPLHAVMQTSLEPLKVTPLAPPVASAPPCTPIVSQHGNTPGSQMPGTSCGGHLTTPHKPQLLCPVITPAGTYYSPVPEPGLLCPNLSASSVAPPVLQPHRPLPHTTRSALSHELIDLDPPGQEGVTYAQDGVAYDNPHTDGGSQDSFSTISEEWDPVFQRYHACANGTLLLSVGKGDITTMSVGAVVNPANGHLRHSGGLAARIVKAGGESIQRDSEALVRTQGPVQPGRIAITGPGNLPCNLVIHAVGPLYDSNQHDTSCRILREAVEAAILYASQASQAEMPLRSIALPAISAGIFGFPIRACANEIVKTIMPLIHGQMLNLQEIRLVGSLEATVKALQDALQGYVRPSKPTIISRKLPIMVEDASDDQVPVRTQKAVLDKDDSEPLMYIKFTPGQAATLVSTLPDPEAQPMPFYRRIVQIQKMYAATWQDLMSLAQIKAGDSYWPVMEGALNDSRLSSEETWQSGVTFCEQLKSWAQDRLSDQATSLKDVTQDQAESVEKYASRLTQMFADLGFSQQIKPQAQLLSQAFVAGLREELRNNIMKTRPEIENATMTDAIIIAKSFQKNMKPSKKAMVVLAEEDSENPQYVMSNVSPFPTQVYPPAIYQTTAEPSPQFQNYPDQRGVRGPCFRCGREGHIKRDCRVPPNRYYSRNGDNRQLRRPYLESQQVVQNQAQQQPQ
ncbi:uncharacterized protein ACNLHF_001266 [Anomaloglossus baeobatrachus]